jgi:hypothetical protein
VYGQHRRVYVRLGKNKRKREPEYSLAAGYQYIYDYGNLQAYFIANNLISRPPTLLDGTSPNISNPAIFITLKCAL